MLGFSLFGIDAVFWKEVGNILAFLAAGALGYVIPQVSKKIKMYMRRKFFNISLKKSLEIKVKMAEIKTRMKATRIYLYQFHNGTVFLGDHSFHKYNVSAIFEVVTQGLSRDIQNMQSVPMSRFAELLTLFVDKDYDTLVVGDHRGTDMTFEDADLEDLKYTLTPKTVAFIKVINERNSFVGLIAIHFDQEFTKSKFAMEMAAVPDVNALLVDIKKQI